MRDFEWCQPRTLDEALADLASGGALAAAGGVDVLDRLKEGLDTPPRLVSLRRVAGMDSVREAADGTLEVGPLATLSRLAEHPLVREGWPALAEAARQIATPNVRNAATVAGNLLQRPRCWYFRNASFPCARKAGGPCFAQQGRNAGHAVLGNDLCAMVHPSDLAVPLVAHGATLAIASRTGRRFEQLESLYVGPDEDVTREHRLAAGDLVVGVSVPRPPRGGSGFVRVCERASAGWPIASAAAVLTMNGARCTHASVVLGAAAPVPWRAPSAEAELLDRVVDEATIERAARAAVAEARPLAENAHKVHLLAVAVRRVLSRVASPRPDRDAEPPERATLPR